MWINNLSLPIHSHSWGTMWLDRVPQTQLATCGPLIHLALFKWPQIWHKVHNNHMSNGVLISSGPATYLVWNFKKVHAKKLKFTVTFRQEIDRASTKIPFIIMRAKNMMVWWMVQVWPQNTIWSSNLRVSHTLFHKLWSTVVWPNLPKFITN